MTTSARPTNDDDELQQFLEELYLDVVIACTPCEYDSDPSFFCTWRGGYDGLHWKNPQATIFLTIAEDSALESDGSWEAGGYDVDVLRVCRVLKISPNSRKPVFDRGSVEFRARDDLDEWLGTLIEFWGTFRNRSVCVRFATGRIMSPAEKLRLLQQPEEPVATQLLVAEMHGPRNRNVQIDT